MASSRIYDDYPVDYPQDGLRIRMDNRWTCDDMKQVCEALGDLYNLGLFIVETGRMENVVTSRHVIGKNKLKPWAKPRPAYALRISSIEYSSPGQFALFGVGSVVSNLRLFLVELLHFCAPSSIRQRELENDRRAIENDALLMKNAERYLNLLQKAGYSKKELKTLVPFVESKQQVFRRMVEERKITEIDEA